MSEPLQVAIVGYGLAGRAFHAPLVAATPGLCVAAVVSADPARRAAAAREHPGARLLGRVDDAWTLPGGVDLTLAGLLGFQGVLLYVLGDTGTINLNDDAIVRLANTFYSDYVGWIIAAVLLVPYVLITLNGHRRRLASGLESTPFVLILIRMAVVVVGVLVAVAVLNADRGVPLATLIFVGLVILVDFITRRTAFGRHVYAVGGNAEAARRAGISLSRIRMIVFAAASTLAALGGIMAASRLFAVNQASGSGDLLLNAIAAAVIGGTSLFGGRGTAWSALLGALVIGSISNGMDLKALGSPEKFMVTGAVLLLAVTVDATARRGRQSSGRA